ncbi:hypothetical protein J5226_04375 [Lysobacter sp. K5869]|uniref:hypothetical protein n=1 Tax=Lysobacter sp. K5869 TaxID=2820808 RepID=UPI001C06109B|nr:hypothetical protein [Lysobacter sp. K5869]QWP77654.1 hypothetical protein J5226_04375 [Lysobacter sp. K5869]
MNAPSPDTTLQSIARDIEQFKRQSKSAIPAGVVGLVLMFGGLAYSGWQLTTVGREVAEKRREIAEKDREVAAKRQQAADLDLSLSAKAAQLAQADQQRAERSVQLESLQLKIDELNRNLNAIATAPNAAQKNAELDAAMVRAKDLNTAIASATATDAAAPRYGAYRVDVFYCADRAARNKPLAEQARTLGQNGATQGRWQVRELSEKSNASPGYGIRSDVIRFESDEKAMAGKLRDDVTQLTRVALSAQQINYRTPNYISLFFCGEG